MTRYKILAKVNALFVKELNLFYKHYFFSINWCSFFKKYHNKKTTSIQNSKLDHKDLEKSHDKE